MKDQTMNVLSRRSFLGTSAAMATAALIPARVGGTPAINQGTAARAAGEGSNFGGVQIGAIGYSWRSLPGGLENTIKYCKGSGLNSLELMNSDLEVYLGAPAEREKLKNWRISSGLAKVADAKKLLDEAGINVHLVNAGPVNWSDEEIDYVFEAAKALGAKGVVNEIGENAVKRLGPIAEKHGMYAVFHNHGQFGEIEGFSYDPFLAVSPAVRMNFDIGHFYGTTGIHPKEIIRKYHDRIFSLHLKDKTGPTTEPRNANQVWGQGETPIADVLLLLQKEKWPIFCDIELEYEIKPWSDAVKEVRNCVNFARQILV